MDPITIGLAIAGAKKLLEASSDIKDIAGSIENLFHLTEKSKKNTKPNQSDTSIKSVVKDVIEERNNKTRLRNLEIDIDNKFGLGTWAAIKEERERRLVKAAKEEKASDKFYATSLYWLGEFGKLLAVIALSGGAGYVIWINRCVDGMC